MKLTADRLLGFIKKLKFAKTSLKIHPIPQQPVVIYLIRNAAISIKGARVSQKMLLSDFPERVHFGLSGSSILNLFLRDLKRGEVVVP